MKGTAGTASLTSNLKAKQKRLYNSTIFLNGAWSDADVRVWTKILLGSIEEMIERNLNVIKEYDIIDRSKMRFIFSLIFVGYHCRRISK